MNFDGLEEIVRAAGCETAAAVRPADEVEHRIEKFLVEADAKINECAEAAADQFHGAMIPRRFACLSQSASSSWNVAWGARQRMTVTR